MSSSSKKSRKRNLSPEADTNVTTSTKKSRSNQGADTPDGQNPPSRPSTRSTPLGLSVLSTPTSSRRRSNIRKSPVSKSTRKRASVSGSSRISAVTGEDEESIEERPMQVNPPVGVLVTSDPSLPSNSPPSRRSSSSTSSSRSTTKKTPQPRRNRLPPSRLLPSVTASDPVISACEVNSSSMVIEVPVEKENEGVEAAVVTDPEPFGNTVELSIIRLSRTLVLFTILLVAFVSLVRLDHDKHDTHGSISRSGRKMYSFLTLGLVETWEWGVRREDISLLLRAEALQQRLQQAEFQKEQTQALEQANTAVHDMIDEVDKAANRLRTSLSTKKTHVVSATAIKKSYHATTKARYQQLRLALAAAQGDMTLDSQIDNILNKIVSVRKNICTIDSCKVWSNFHENLGRVSGNMNANVFNESDLLSYKHSVFNKLTQMVDADISFANINIARHFIETSVKQLDSKCSATDKKYSIEVMSCLQNILAYNIDSMPSSESNVITGAGAEVEDIGAVVIRDTSAQDRGPLEAKIHALLLSEEYAMASEDTLREWEMHDVCVALIKKLMRVEMHHFREYIAARIKDNHDSPPATATATAEDVKKTFNSSTHLVDYAVAPRGGRVVSATKKLLYTLTAPPFIPTVLTSLLGRYGDPSIMISSSSPPPALGECYAFEGSSGNVTVLLAAPTAIQKIGVYQKNEGFVEASAVRSFRVFGWTDVPPTLMSKQLLNQNQVGDTILDMGTFFMDDQLQDELDDESGGSFRVFSLLPPAQKEVIQPVRAVTIQFQDNFGSEEFTCVYRLQLLGESMH